MADDFKRFRVDCGGRLPMLEVELRAGCEEDGELAALRPEPEAILAAEDVDVRLEFAGGDELAIDPAEALAARRAGRARHHAPLPGRNDDDLGRPARIAEEDNGSVLA